LALTEPTIRCSLLLSGLNPFAMLPAEDILALQPEVLVVHGTYDEVVPASTGHSTRDAFVRHGGKVQYAEYPIGHTIDLKVIAAVTNYLGATL